MTQPKQRDIIMIFGKQGSGKTTLAKRVIDLYKRVIIIDRLGEYQYTICNDTKELLNRIQSNSKEYKLSIQLKDEDLNLFKVLSCISNYMLVIEELSLYCTPYNIDKDLFKILSYGRHYGQSVLGISQRPAQIHKMVTSQATLMYSYGMTEPNDLKYLSVQGFKRLTELKQFEYEKIELQLPRKGQTYV